MIRKLLIGLITTVSLAGLAIVPSLLVSSPVFAADVLQGDGCGSSSSCSCDPSTQACTACNNPNAASKPAFCSDNNTSGQNPLLGSQGLVTKFISILSFAVGVLSVVMIIFGGIRYITSNGDSNTVNAAQKTVIYALAGLVVAALSQAMVIFVLSKVKG